MPEYKVKIVRTICLDNEVVVTANSIAEAVDFAKKAVIHSKNFKECWREDRFQEAVLIEK